MNPHDICYWAIHADTITAQTDEFRLGDNLPILPPNHIYSFKEPDGGPFERFSEIQWRNYIYDYYRMIEKLDGDVGRMLDALDSRNDDTIVIFTSDHGEGRGRHRRVQKWHPYDESVKVPLILSCPGRFRENAIDAESLVSGIDIMATVCDYAGVKPPPHNRGHSLRPLLESGAGAKWRNNVYSEIRMTGRIIRTSRYKYVKFYQRSGDQDRPFVTTDGKAEQFAPGQGHRYKVNPIRLLFDMEDDPWETVNLAEGPGYADVIAAHEKILTEEYEAQLIPGVHYDRN